MTAAAALVALYARGARIEVRADGRIGVTPASALDDEIRAAIHEYRCEVVAILRGEVPVPPDPTIAPPPCGQCGSGVFWRQSGRADVHCATCRPPESWGDVYAYLAKPTTESPTADVIGGVTEGTS